MPEWKMYDTLLSEGKHNNSCIPHSAVAAAAAALCVVIRRVLPCCCCCCSCYYCCSSWCAGWQTSCCGPLDLISAFPSSSFTGPRQPYCTPVCFFPRPYCTPSLYVFPPRFFVNFVFSTAAAILFTVHKWPMKHALRLTANLPNQSLFVPAVYRRRKLTFTPILFVLPVDLSN